MFRIGVIFFFCNSSVMYTRIEWCNIMLNFHSQAHLCSVAVLQFKRSGTLSYIKCGLVRVRACIWKFSQKKKKTANVIACFVPISEVSILSLTMSQSSLWPISLLKIINRSGQREERKNINQLRSKWNQFKMPEKSITTQLNVVQFPKNYFIR